MEELLGIKLEDLVQILLCSVGVVLALAFSVSASKKVSKLLLYISAAVATVGGCLIYGYTYAYLCDSVIVAAFRTIIAVIRSFAGVNSLADTAATPLSQYIYFQIPFWTIQLLCIFSTAHVALATVGSNLLQNLRLRFNRRSELYVVYGLNDETLRFANDTQSKRKVTLVFVEAKPGADISMAAKQRGFVVKSDADALNGTVRFLSSVGMRSSKRRCHVFALNEDTVTDQIFARKLLASMDTLGIEPSRTALTVLGDEDDTENQLFHNGDVYGFGNVYCVNKPYLTARLLLRTAPTYRTIPFDDYGRAKDDFYGLLIGCDRVGQAVLRQIVMNTQFEGSQFHLAVFAPDIEQVIGRMSYENAQMLSEYDIQFFSHDARSKKFYEYVDNTARKLNYVVLCTGNRARNMEIAQQLLPFLSRKGCNLPIYQCDRSGVRYIQSADSIVEKDIFTAELLCSDVLDKVAIALNHTYCGSGDPVENWAKCDFFGRMSSRASADFLSAMLYASHKTPENWEPEGDLLENLAKTEHKRWCAFHYAMGFSTMSGKQWEERAAAYQKETAKTGSSKIRIGKDLIGRTHACLIAWDALDELSERESALTGKAVDYKQMDRNNVLSLAQLSKQTDSV